MTKENNPKKGDSEEEESENEMLGEEETSGFLEEEHSGKFEQNFKKMSKPGKVVDAKFFYAVIFVVGQILYRPFGIPFCLIQTSFKQNLFFYDNFWKTGFNYIYIS